MKRRSRPCPFATATRNGGQPGRQAAGAGLMTWTHPRHRRDLWAGGINPRLVNKARGSSAFWIVSEWRVHPSSTPPRSSGHRGLQTAAPWRPCSLGGLHHHHAARGLRHLYGHRCRCHRQCELGAGAAHEGEQPLRHRRHRRLLDARNPASDGGVFYYLRPAAPGNALGRWVRWRINHHGW